ncbi:MAG: hypothetical protein ACKO7W_19380 [Elainella sp.]
MFPDPFQQMPAAATNQVQQVRGSNFTYLLPPGWFVGEEGNYSLSLRSRDFRAGITVFGQSGMMYPMTPDQYAYQVMTSVMRLSNVQFSQPRPIQPMPGCTQAMILETLYPVAMPNGAFMAQGIVVSNVAIGYNQCDAVMTLVAADTALWPQYQSWLPQVGLAACNTGPDPYGRTSMAGVIRGIAVQDHQAYTAYSQWSNHLWQQVTDDRNASIDRQQDALGQTLTGQVWVNSRYDGRSTRQSTTPAVIWESRDGRRIASDDPSFDPRTPIDSDWRRLR